MPEHANGPFYCAGSSLIHEALASGVTAGASQVI